jgi:hypothetical protein
VKALHFPKHNPKEEHDRPSDRQCDQVRVELHYWRSRCPSADEDLILDFGFWIFI